MEIEVQVNYYFQDFKENDFKSLKIDSIKLRCAVSSALLNITNTAILLGLLWKNFEIRLYGQIREPYLSFMVVHTSGISLPFCQVSHGYDL